MPINAAIFDMDGLLINSEQIALALFLDLCQKHNLGEMRSLYMACLGTNDVETHRLVTEALSGKTDAEQFMREFHAQYHTATTTRAVPLMKGVESLLNMLEEHQIIAAVATSTSTKLALHKLENCNLLHRFEFVVGGDQIANGKPAPDIYLHAVEKLGKKPGDCIALEDSPNGVKAAVAAGLNVIQIPDIVEPDEELLSLGHTVLDSLLDVVNWLREQR